jgi:hypothetical protein
MRSGRISSSGVGGAQRPTSRSGASSGLRRKRSLVSVFVTVVDEPSAAVVVTVLVTVGIA